jgi:CRISPR-associated endoribonuclease Cas6
MRKYPYAPHPFVITPPLEEKRGYKEGDTLCFELTLIGKSVDFLPYFIFTFDELGKMGIGRRNGKYKLEEVKSKRDLNVEEVFYSSTDKVLRQSVKPIGLKEIFHSSSIHSLVDPLTLHFITPTRLKFDGRLSSTLEFHILIRNLLRRVSLISYFHCGEELNLDYKGLIDSSKEIKTEKENLSWFDWERYSNRQETRMKMGGFIGSITFEGDFDKFLPLLLLGENIHVGKGTSFGLGKYQIMGN